MEKPNLRRLFLLSLRVGNLTFGGGNPTMAVFQRELVNRNAWLSPEQYALSYGLARLTPGTNVLAFCAAAGWQLLRGWGAVSVVLAVSVPSAILVVLLTHAFESWKSNPFVEGALSGLAAAAVGMMAASAWMLLRPGLARGRRARTVALVGGAFFLSFALALSPVQVLALAALAGAFWKEAPES